jgi:hypothetical protein
MNQANVALESAAVADGVPHHRPVVLAAAALTAAVAGGAVGAMAGPAFALAGAAIGVVAGAVAGYSMEKEVRARDAHDRELDDMIGVTAGTIGTAEENKRPSRDVIEEAELEEARRRGEL